jgi:hypothetical protein
VETGAVAVLDLAGTRSADTAAAVLRSGRAPPGAAGGALGHRPGAAVRASLTTTDRRLPLVRLRLGRLPASRPACNAGEAIGDWVCVEGTANPGVGRAAAVREIAVRFVQDLAGRVAALQRRCRTALQARADALAAADPRPLIPYRRSRSMQIPPWFWFRTGCDGQCR